MDQNLEKRWRTIQAPFDGATLTLSDYVPVAELRDILIRLVSMLQRKSFGNLKKLDDWHEHDGFIVESADATWEDLENALRDEDSLYESRQGDTYVRRAFYDASNHFLLRYYIMDKDEDADHYPGIQGDFDLTAQPVVIDEVRSIFESISDKIIVKNSKEFFDKNYAG